MAFDGVWIHVLNMSFNFGRRLKGGFIRMILNTRSNRITCVWYMNIEKLFQDFQIADIYVQIQRINHHNYPRHFDFVCLNMI